MPVKGPDARARRRILLLMCGFVFLGFTVVAVRLFYVQVIKYDFYHEKALYYQTSNSVVTPSRGAIYDRNMKELAVSASTETVQLDPNLIVSKTKQEKGITAEMQQQELAAILAQELELTYEKVLTQVQTQGTQAVVIKKGVERDIVDSLKAALEKAGCTGVNYVPDTKRYYPYGNFAAHVLGFLRSDGVGLAGIEAQYDDVLSGTAGRVVKATNGKGYDMPIDYEQYIPAQDGQSVVLTIDEAIQHFLEKHLETAMSDNPTARGGVGGIIMDVKTGEILAMASKPDFDSNDPRTITSQRQLNQLQTNITQQLQENGLTATVSEDFLKYGGLENMTESDAENDKIVDIFSNARTDALDEMWRNRPIADSYEPGSTFKLMNVATAYELGLVNESSSFFCGGGLMVEGWSKRINCWKKVGHGNEDLMHSLMNSCNVAMMNIAAKTGTARFYEYFDAFGLLSRTGIDLPGEAGSYFHAKDKFTNVDLAVACFGQRFQVTPIQMITMVSAIVDDGKLKTPHVVKEIVDTDGNVKQTFGTELIRQVIAPETSSFMREAMEQVVENGTGQNAYVAGYRVGGKTATSEIARQKGDVEDRYTASFIGVAPMDDPQIICLVAVFDMPDSSLHGGSTVAAPVVGRIFSDVLPYVGIETQFDEEETDRREIATPNVVGKTRAEAQALLTEAGISFKLRGDEDKITDQVPSGGAKVPANAQMILYCGGTKSNNQISVPDVRGLSPAQAQQRLAALGLYMKRTGIATKNTNYMTNAAKQSPAAGTQVGIGTVVAVEFSNSTNIGD